MEEPSPHAEEKSPCVRRVAEMKANDEEASPGMLLQVGPCGRDIDEATARRAADAIRAGGVIALPTDTLYGVACDARNAEALRKLCALKGRDPSKPVAVAVAAAADIPGVAACGPDPALQEVLSALLPGPFTAVLPRSEALPFLNPGTATLGVRVVPDSAPVATQLCAKLGPGAALALTSANLSGAMSPLTVADFADIHDHIDLVLDGGEIPAASRAGSTVVDLSRPGEYKVLREGVPGTGEQLAAAAEKAGLRRSPG